MYPRRPGVPNASCELGTLKQLSGRCLSLQNPGGYLVMGSSCYKDPKVFQQVVMVMMVMMMVMMVMMVMVVMMGENAGL